MADGTSRCGERDLCVAESPACKMPPGLPTCVPAVAGLQSCQELSVLHSGCTGPTSHLGQKCFNDPRGKLQMRHTTGAVDMPLSTNAAAVGRTPGPGNAMGSRPVRSPAGGTPPISLHGPGSMPQRGSTKENEPGWSPNGLAVVHSEEWPVPHTILRRTPAAQAC